MQPAGAGPTPAPASTPTAADNQAAAVAVETPERSNVKEYHKIQSVYKRDEKTHKFIIGDFSLPEFYYLQDNVWMFTEKIDGTNIRVIWDGETVRFGGRTDKAQIPAVLVARLQDIFTVDLFQDSYADEPMCLYGEGFGARIQKGGGNYNPNGVDFILFDVLINDYWLRRDDVEDIADTLGISVVPDVGRGTIHHAVERVKNGFTSTFGNFMAEGLVLRPAVELFTRNGDRIITKIKHRDF